MPSELDRWSIHNKLVRVVLFRVFPGHENRVGRIIERKCMAAGLKRDSFRVLRLFGNYDLVFIQDDCNITESDLVKFGAIEGITGSTEYVCYKWQEGGPRSRRTFNIQSLSEPLVGLCFVKINPLLTQKFGVVPEINFADYVLSKDPSVQVLGTLGWSEVILVVSDSSLAGILRHIGAVFTLIFQHADRKREMFAEKTLTMLGHDIDLSNPQVRGQKLVLIETELRGEGRKRGDLEIHFSASCTPEAMAKLEHSARHHFSLTDKDDTRVTFRLGARDLDFSVPLKEVKTLNGLVALLDEFRRENMDALIRTHTEFQYRIRKRDSNQWGVRGLAVKPRKTLLLRLSARHARYLASLGPEGASAAAAIYHFNNLVANRLLLDAFSDMARALVKLKQETLRLPRRLNVKVRRQLATRLLFLQQAISQRYQGAYLGVEESPWGASFGIQPAGIGIQRILKAIELFALEILRQLGRPWSGFVSVGRHRSPTIIHWEDILFVPPGDALDARKHWVISHEVMHILQHLAPEKFGLRSFRTSNDGTVLKESDEKGTLIREAMTDIMEFRLSCTLPVHEYLRMIWGYLKDGLFGLDDVERLGSYLIRSFAVYWDDKYGHLKHPVTDAQTEWLFFHEFVELVKSFDIDFSQIEHEDERGQSLLRRIFYVFRDNIQLYLPLIRERIEALATSAWLQPANKAAVARAVARLQEGQIVSPGDMKRPDAIAWALGSKNIVATRRDSQTVAWLLSLWHYYHVQKRGPDLSKTVLNRRKITAK